MNQESAWDRAHSLTVSCLRFVRLLELVSAARFVLGRGKGGGHMASRLAGSDPQATKSDCALFAGPKGSSVRSATFSCFV